ncbi:MAG: threonylcarbamoyl-AMP synthase [Gammaproteobacteria bacterium]|nr:threonylcarbamoyl-AMP synthase [Gammaproteobacteria bacterium]
MISTKIDEAVTALKQGDVIAYPTEAVFGLGCDPFNKTAVERLLSLKRRSVSKGLILIASDWNQISSLTRPIDESTMNRAQNTWPGPYTWIFPASDSVPPWIRGDYPGIALRVTQHPLASALCEAFGGPIVSTSANLEGTPPAKAVEDLVNIFPTGIGVILAGPLGDSENPTTIRDVLTGDFLRK